MHLFFLAQNAKRFSRWPTLQHQVILIFHWRIACDGQSVLKEPPGVFSACTKQVPTHSSRATLTILGGGSKAPEAGRAGTAALTSSHFRLLLQGLGLGPWKRGPRNSEPGSGERDRTRRVGPCMRDQARRGLFPDGESHGTAILGGRARAGPHPLSLHAHGDRSGDRVRAHIVGP